jgi:hypothetical protein
LGALAAGGRDEHGQAVRIREGPGCDSLSQLLDAPIDVGSLLRIAIDITSCRQDAPATSGPQDVKPANILVNSRRTDPVYQLWNIVAPPARMTATRASPVHRRDACYVAPEQTGRMNRSIDSRSDLYALGGPFYQKLTGNLPLTAVDAIVWIHCHIAQQPPLQRAGCRVYRLRYLKSSLGRPQKKRTRISTNCNLTFELELHGAECSRRPRITG